MGFKDFWNWMTFKNFRGNATGELDDYGSLSKSIGRSPVIDDPLLMRDLVSQRDFEDSTIEKIEYAPNSKAREAWRDDPAAQREAERAAKREAKERKREERERRREEKRAEQEYRRALAAEREARRQEYLQERRDAGHDDDDDSDFVD